MSNSNHQAPCVEDANEETGSVIDGTAVFAASPMNQKPKTGRSRKEKLPRRSSSSNGPTDSNSTALPTNAPKWEKDFRHREKDPQVKTESKPKDREREKPRDSNGDRDRDRDRDERTKSSKTVTIEDPKGKRPKPILRSHSSSNSNPKSQDAYRRPTGVIDDPSHFGVLPSARAGSRPSSGYYGPGSRPPAANELWHTQHSTPPPHPFDPYGTSPYNAPPPPAMPGAYPMPPSPTDYFTPTTAGVPVGSMTNTPTSHLARRFSLRKPGSASGFRPQPTPPSQSYEEYYDEGQYHHGGDLSRRFSLSKSRKDEDDRRKVPPPSPPPPRSNTTDPGKGSPFLPPPPGPPKLNYKYEDEDLAAAKPNLYRDVPSRNASWSYGELAAPPRCHRRDSMSHEQEGHKLEPAGNRRRHSYIGTSAGSDHQDKLRGGGKYQGQISGGSISLTKETLSKVDRQKLSSDKSSRSPRSGGASRNESDYSNTTRTTRSFAGDGETNIRIRGGATLRLGDMEIQC